MKRCSRCQQFKGPFSFGMDGRGGRRAECLECRAMRIAERKTAQPADPGKDPEVDQTLRDLLARRARLSVALSTVDQAIKRLEALT